MADDANGDANDADSGIARTPASPPGMGAVFEARGVTKSFGGVTVLRDVSVNFSPGEVHSLIGENGAGKSTLLKIMAGMYPSDEGTLVLGGNTLPPLTPSDAQRHGIYLVPQEPRLMPDLSVAENLYLGTQLARRPGRVAWRQMNAATEALISAVGLHASPRVPAGRLSLAQQQLLDCARALSRGCEIIFFDEPTSPLTAHDAEPLFDLMSQLRARGLTLGFISHRLDEIEAISDRVTVLRDGAVVAREERGTWTRDKLVTAMISREPTISRQARLAPRLGPVMFEVEDLFAPPEVNGMSLRVRAGEIVGLAGLVGSGRTEFAETVFGIRAAAGGTVRVNSRNITGATPRKCIGSGLIYLAEDRGRNGILADLDIARNATSAVAGRLPRLAGTFIRSRQEQALARGAAQEMDVRASSIVVAMKTLSGGNQQKALLARWLLAKPLVAIFDEPTRGVDIGAKENIREIIESLAANGLAAVVISSELEELVRLCHRVYCVYEGRITGEVAGAAVTLEALGQLAVGA